MTILHFLTRLFIALYAILTAIAASSDIREIGFSFWHLLYFIGSILLIGSAIRDHSTFVYFSLFFMVGVALINGIITSTLDWQHILVRVIISVIVASLYFFSK